MKLIVSDSQVTPIDRESFGNLTLKGFQEIALPEEVSWLPVTPGWYLLLLALLTWGGYRLYRHYCHWRKNRYRRQAMTTLKQVMTQNLPPTETLQQLTTLLKATALETYPRANVASLAGREWIAFLNQQTDEDLFDERASALLQSGQYSAGNRLSQKECLCFARKTEQWLLTHREVSTVAELTGERHA